MNIRKMYIQSDAEFDRAVHSLEQRLHTFAHVHHTDQQLISDFYCSRAGLSKSINEYAKVININLARSIQ